MESFEAWMKGLMSNMDSVPFAYSPRDIAAEVYIASYSGVKYDDTTNTRQYTITLNVDRGAEALALQTQISEANAVATLQGEINGVGWTRNSYTYVSTSADADDLKTFWAALDKVYAEAGNYSGDAPSLEQLMLNELSADGTSSSVDTSVTANTNYISANDIFKEYFGAVPYTLRSAE